MLQTVRYPYTGNGYVIIKQGCFRHPTPLPYGIIETNNLLNKHVMGATARFFSTTSQIIAAKRGDNAMCCLTCAYAVENPYLGFSDTKHIMCRRFGRNLIKMGQYAHGPDAPQQFIVRVGSEQEKRVLAPYPLAHTLLNDGKCEEHRECGSLTLITRPFARGRCGRSRQP
jgi:hypothetical protein